MTVRGTVDTSFTLERGVSRQKVTMMKLTILYFVLAALLLFHSVFPATGSSDQDDFYAFVEACTMGRLEEVNAQLARNPSWAKRNDLGETCLHAAGIHGHADVTRAVLEQGGDPNVWTSFDHNRTKVYALSFHVFSGHAKSAEILLDYGADINALITSQEDPSKLQTALDITLNTLKNDELNKEPSPCNDKFHEMKELLLKKGAKTYEQLQQKPEQHDEL